MRKQAPVLKPVAEAPEMGGTFTRAAGIEQDRLR